MITSSDQVLHSLVSQALKSADYDRYLSTLYAPESRRAALASLFAFNAEVMAIRDRIREALPGEIRLQWWRDVIANDQLSGHPVADALISTIRQHDLSRTALDNFLEARIFDLYDDPMPSRTELEGYCGETDGALIQLAAIVLDAEAAPAVAFLAGHGGCVTTITRLVRLLPIHRARGQCYAPRNLLAAVGATAEEFIAEASPELLSRVANALIALAEEHLVAFRKGSVEMPQSLRPAFLPLALAPARLNKLRHHDFRLSKEPVDISSIQRHWVMFRRATSGW